MLLQAHCTQLVGTPHHVCQCNISTYDVFIFIYCILFKCVIFCNFAGSSGNDVHNSLLKMATEIKSCSMKK